MNAAVSLTMCAFGRLAWKMLPLYVSAQFLGSFLAAATIYAVYYGGTSSVHPCCASVFRHSTLFPFAEAIYDYCGGNMTVMGVKATAGIFATYPAPYLSLFGGFIDQVAVKASQRGLGHHLRLFSSLTGDICAARCLGPPCFCSV